jgi:hypothetical protein
MKNRDDKNISARVEADFAALVSAGAEQIRTYTNPGDLE